MKYRARNIYIALISFIGFCFFVNSLLHFDYSKTPETLILALYYSIATFFLAALFKKNCHFSINAPLHLLSILILGTQGVVSLVLGIGVMSVYHWRRNVLSLPALAFSALYFAPALYLGTFVYHYFGGTTFSSFSNVPYVAIGAIEICLVAYGFLLFNGLTIFAPDKTKIHSIITLLDVADNMLFPLTFFILFLYQVHNSKGLIFAILPFTIIAYVIKSLIRSFFEKEEFASALAITSKLIESSLDLKTMVFRVAEQVQSIFEVTTVEIFLKNNESWERKAFVGNSPWKGDKLDNNFIAEMQRILPQSPVTLYGSSLNGFFYPYKTIGSGSLLVIPLISKQEYIGAIICSHSASCVFDQTHENFSKNLIARLSTALVSAQLHDRLISTMKELREAKEQLLHFEKMTSIGQLAAGLAHEFNTPLSTLLIKVDSLKNSIETLPNNIQPQLIEETCLVFESQINRLINIVENICSFAKLEGREEVWSHVDIQEIIEHSLQNLNEHIPQQIKVHIDVPKLPSLWCNSFQVQQLFQNILSNAFLAIKGYGSIWITGYIEKKQLIVSIRDNGIGIPKTIQNRIFDPFFTTREIGFGTGLGLSVAYGIMQRHLGKISFESQENIGTTFYLEFPLTKSLLIQA